MGSSKTAGIRMHTQSSLDVPAARTRSRQQTERKVPVGTTRQPVTPKPAQLSRHTPRKIRARVNRAQQAGRKSDTGASPVEELPAEKVPAVPLARNNSTGRVAMGPWMGEFGGIQGDTGATPEPMFLDGTGTVFLAPAGVPFGAMQQRGDATGSGTTASSQGATVSVDRAAAAMQLHLHGQAQQLAVAAARPPKRAHPSKMPQSARGNARVRSHGPLMQPRPGH